ncbi:hypothetical protein QKU48_gp1172 [Fadolivirus algeromassiliense]|jgi:hypothetical protein|uniref:Uncharacterized protein n=1 Tax=Fadolivirus FV1/VV64 TaxID=3070911 RepID=A0A7D3UTW0_9VIRU|nr:hypothetical protein QKU48_gp1172 [Fadolivirus algeromassiliense]QKF94630.1 hypothetical protein Fadolivirus_1_1172 [Fadolivirus FV1/VV64]
MDCFNWKLYRYLNNDLVNAKFDTEKQIQDHWNQYGKYEKRRYKVTDITPDFNWQIYSFLNPDLEKNGIQIQNDIELHWVMHGIKEKRKYNVTDITPEFDWEIYAYLNPDLEKNGIVLKSNVELHWLMHGIREKRKYKVTDITPDFNWKTYAKLNPDLEKNGIVLKSNVELHWFKHGIREKRKYKLNDVFIIKYYIQSSLKNYIMQSLHEEIDNILGIIDTDFINYDNIAEYFINKYKKLPMAILFLWDFTDNIYKKIKKYLPNTKIILWTDDLHWYTKIQYEKNYYSYSHADIHLSHYNYFKMFYNLDILPTNMIRLYHSCGSNFYRTSINMKSINKIYMYGAINAEHYRLRTWFLNLMQTHYPDKIIYKKHPGYDGIKVHDSIETSNELYNYTFCYTSGAFPNFEIKENTTTPYYIIGKFFEIAGSGALLLCNDYNIKDELNLLGFYDMINYISINENNFFSIIKWIFDSNNIGKINTIRKNGHELITKMHITEKRIEFINNELKLKLTK